MSELRDLLEENDKKIVEIVQNHAKIKRLIIQQENEKKEPEFEYPIVCKHNDGCVVMFHNLHDYELLMNWGVSGKVGGKDCDLNGHTSPFWTQIPYDKERGLFHKQIVWEWSNKDTAARELVVYNANRKNSFWLDGTEAKSQSDNYEPYQGEYLPWMLGMIKACEN